MNTKFYITTPIYYVNDVPHIGHSYTQIAADVIARWKRQNGYDVFFLTGTDEHGMKIAISADEAGRTPQEQVDLMAQKYMDVWKDLNISYDGFVRTTDKVHVETVQNIFKTLHEKGDIYKGDYEGWYCRHCETYWTAFQLDGKEECKDCGRKVEKIKEEAYFLKLTKYQDRLLKYINENPDFIQPASRRNEAINFIEGGLKDINVSRTNFTWGIKVPFDEKHVVYVWFDALINYISAIGYIDNKEKFNKLWPADIHMMGKEIVRFHAVIWPIILMALDLPLPKKIFGHGWWTTEGQKMSKSKGNVVDPVKLAAEFGLDTIRYFVLREVPFGQDGDFSRQSLINRYNADLANDLGNLLSRTLTMIEKYFEGVVPVCETKNMSGLDKEIHNLSLTTINDVIKKMGDIALTDALASIWDLVSASNVYIEKKQPWALAKEKKTEELSLVMANLFLALRIVSVLIASFMPKTSVLIREQMGIDPDPVSDRALLEGRIDLNEKISIKKTAPLFPRIAK